MHRNTYIAIAYTITQYIITYLLLGCRGGIFNFPTTTNHLVVGERSQQHANSCVVLGFILPKRRLGLGFGTRSIICFHFFIFFNFLLCSVDTYIYLKRQTKNWGTNGYLKNT